MLHILPQSELPYEIHKPIVIKETYRQYFGGVLTWRDNEIVASGTFFVQARVFHVCVVISRLSIQIARYLTCDQILFSPARGKKRDPPGNEISRRRWVRMTYRE